MSPLPRHPLDVAALVVGALLALLLGAVAGVVLSFLHAQWAPWGLLGALAVTTALVTGVRLVFGRIVALAEALGVLAATAVLAVPGPGGSVVIQGDLAGWLWILVPPVVAAVVLVAGLRPLRPSRLVA